MLMTETQSSLWSTMQVLYVKMALNLFMYVSELPNCFCQGNTTVAILCKSA